MKNREIAGVKVFVSNEAYDEYKGTLQEQINKLQSNWNSLREWVKTDNTVFETNFEMGRCVNFKDILDKMNELEGGEDAK